MNKDEKNYFEALLNKKISSKKNINKLLKEKYIHNYPLTNINKTNNTTDIYNFNYNYQRFDSSLTYNDFEKTFYNIKGISSKTIFTNCGMSSIFAVLFNLSKIGNYKITLAKDSYFETQQLLKKLNLNFGKKVTYLDTISDEFTFDCNDKNRIVIIDTTCYHPHKFKNLIEKIIQNNNLCILLRSHVKLDMLGLETTFLGSITFFIPNKISKMRFTKTKKLIKNVIDFCGNTGIIATESNIFPILNDKTIIELNKKRIQRITDNNNYFYNKIKQKRNIVLHQHNLFSTIIVNDCDVQKLITFLKKESEKSKGLFFYSGSFGFDYIAVDTYIDLNNNKNTIRISIGDVDKQTIDEFIKYIKGLDYDNI